MVLQLVQTDGLVYQTVFLYSDTIACRGNTVQGWATRLVPSCTPTSCIRDTGVSYSCSATPPQMNIFSPLTCGRRTYASSSACNASLLQSAYQFSTTGACVPGEGGFLFSFLFFPPLTFFSYPQVPAEVANITNGLLAVGFYRFNGCNTESSAGRTIGTPITSGYFSDFGCTKPSIPKNSPIVIPSEGQSCSDPIIVGGGQCYRGSSVAVCGAKYTVQFFSDPQCLQLISTSPVVSGINAECFRSGGIGFRLQTAPLDPTLVTVWAFPIFGTYCTGNTFPSTAIHCACTHVLTLQSTLTYLRVLPNTTFGGVQCGKEATFPSNGQSSSAHELHLGESVMILVILTTLLIAT